MTALLLGIAGEPPLAAVARELARAGLPHVVLDQRALLHAQIDTWWDDRDRAIGIIGFPGGELHLDDITGVYTRLTSWGDLPEVQADSRQLDHAHALHVALEGWLETTRARVVNRTSANDSNNSKPYQALIIRDHFDIPATLVTNDPDAVLAFEQTHGRLIYKSISGERSIVTELTDADRGRLSLLERAPVQFQELVAGFDVRVHVVGRAVFATRVTSDGVDYRYAVRPAQLEPFQLAPDVAGACIALTERLGLELSGIDLRYADDGRIVCFEVNPSPAYIVYEDATGQPIARAIAHHLLG